MDHEKIKATRTNSSIFENQSHFLLIPVFLVEFRRASKFNELFNGIVLYPEEGGITETPI